MNLKGADGLNLDTHLNERRDRVVMRISKTAPGNPFQAVEIDELGTNLLIETLKSNLEDMRATREQAQQDMFIHGQVHP